MVQRPSNSDSPRNRTEKENHATLPQQPDCWTPRKGRNHSSHKTKVLVAKHEPMDRKLCQRMCSLPIKQELDAPRTHTHVLRRTRTRSEPIRRNSNGPHHPTPEDRTYDAILTIVDHGCTRAAIFIPCSTSITGEGIANLYLNNVYQWFGLPRKMISDRDPRFTSHFAKALT